MQIFHRVLALLTLAAFLVTGLYMHLVHDHLQQTPLEIKAFWRSRHIYLLLIGITLTDLSAYIRPHPKLSWLQYSPSIIFGGSAVAITVAFFCEVNQPNLRSPLSAVAIQSQLVGAAMHVYVGRRS